MYITLPSPRRLAIALSGLMSGMAAALLLLR